MLRALLSRIAKSPPSIGLCDSSHRTMIASSHHTVTSHCSMIVLPLIGPHIAPPPIGPQIAPSPVKAAITPPSLYHLTLALTLYFLTLHRLPSYLPHIVSPPIIPHIAPPHIDPHIVLPHIGTHIAPPPSALTLHLPHRTSHRTTSYLGIPHCTTSHRTSHCTSFGSQLSQLVESPEGRGGEGGLVLLHTAASPTCTQ